MTSVEIKELRSNLVNEYKEIVEKAKTENRSLTEDETKLLDEKKTKVEELNEELRKQKETLENYEKEILFKEEEKREKNINNKMEKKISLVKEIREAMTNGTNKFEVNASTELRTMTVQGEGGVHDEVVETEIQGILEPLYANSVMTKLGARWYTGLKHGDVQVPIMGKGTVGWEGEIDEAGATGNTFTTVKLSPKRLSAYVDISKQLIAQDNIGVENAIRRDIINALNDKLEATLLGNAAGTTEKPAGLFYNVSEVNVDDFAGLCQFEAAVEAQNITGEMKYILSPAAKATFRSMIKGTNATGMVFENGEMDGVETLTTTNVAAKKFIYGDFSNLLVGSWDNIEITVDNYTQATKGCVRLVINAFFDFKVARAEAFKFGNVD
jgi:HK97 family phage major capsid protein